MLVIHPKAVPSSVGLSLGRRKIISVVSVHRRLNVFVNISAVNHAGLSTLAENQKISFEVERGNNGKTSAVNLQVL